MDVSILSRLMGSAAACTVLVQSVWASGTISTNDGLETIFVTAPVEEHLGPVSETHHSTSKLDIEALTPTNIGDIIDRLPSAQVATNSRGQSLVTLRGAGERQVALFFEGALLNVPWDNRFDLGVIPSGVITAVTTASGTLSPQYGVNALGAVALYAQDPSEGSGMEGRLTTGSNGLLQGSATLRAQQGDWSFLASAEALALDGQAVADRDRIPLHQPNSGPRTNTDQEQVSVLLRVRRKTEFGHLNATLMYADVERGVAPEGDRPANDVRFWRYPKVETLMAVLSSDARLLDGLTLTTSAWLQDYTQVIDAYGSAAYSIIQETQAEQDTTLGARSILSYSKSDTRVTLSANILHSDHDQIETDQLIGGTEALSFAQTQASGGLDWEWYANDAVTLEASLGVDHIAYTETGDFGDTPGFTRGVYRAGASFALSDTARLRTTVGEKSRMPTMRELFGTAVNRFLVNPNLVPENIRTFEVGYDTKTEQIQLSAVLFHQNVSNTIDQRRVGPLRQRINLAGSTIWGGEVSTELNVTDRLTFSGQATYARVRRKTVLAGETDRIAERPDWLVRATFDYRVGENARMTAEGVYTGHAFSPDTNGAFERLPTSLEINVSARVPIWRNGDNRLDAFVRADNLFDTFVLPQAGLPAPGRTVRAGISARF